MSICDLARVGRRWFPINVEYLFAGTEVAFRLPVAFHAPTHLERGPLPRQRHVTDGTVTGGAADALVDMDAVVEVHELRQEIDARPLDGLAGLETVANRFE